MASRYSPYYRRIRNTIDSLTAAINNNPGLVQDIETGLSVSDSPYLTWDWSAERAQDLARTYGPQAAQSFAGGVAKAFGEYTFKAVTPPVSAPSSVTQVLSQPSSSSSRLRGRHSQRSSGKPKSARNLWPKSPAKNWWELANSSHTPSRSTASFSTPSWGTPSSQLSLNSRLNRRWNRHPLSQRERSWKVLHGNWKFRAAQARRSRIRKKNPVAGQRLVVQLLKRRQRRQRFKLIFASPRSRRRRRRKLSQTRKKIYRYGS